MKGFQIIAISGRCNNTVKGAAMELLKRILIYIAIVNTLQLVFTPSLYRLYRKLDTIIENLKELSGGSDKDDQYTDNNA